jgi:hypothetical protein
VKVCIYQTKFWPEYRRDKVYGKGSSSGSSRGTTSNAGAASFSGLASGQSFYTPDNWFGLPGSTGTTSELRSSGSTNTSSSGYSDAETYASSESEADIPIFFPVPFRELSSLQYHTIDEQLMELAKALKLQFQRHCFIQIRQQETQPMLVPFVEPITTFTYNRKNLDWYIQRQHDKQQALPAAEIDRLLEEQENALLQAASQSPAISLPAESESVPSHHVETSTTTKGSASIWNREGGTKKSAATAQPPGSPLPRKRGPKPDLISHEKVARIVAAYGANWTSDESLGELCDELDQQGVPVPKTWATRPDGHARSWNRAREYYPNLVIKAIKDRCNATQRTANA